MQTARGRSELRMGLRVFPSLENERRREQCFAPIGRRNLWARTVL
jgi:hypothetical protein